MSGLCSLRMGVQVLTVFSGKVCRTLPAPKCKDRAGEKVNKIAELIRWLSFTGQGQQSDTP